MIIIINFIYLIFLYRGDEILHQNRSCIFMNKKRDDFISWLLEILGPVLMGSKPAELISLPKHDIHLSDKLTKIEKYIGKCKKISYIILTYKETSIKVFFYNPICLDIYLSDYKNLRFLKSQGYPENYNFYDYLQYLTNKIEDGFIPDEIGVFLGYPLKDIIGYIGHPSLKLTKINGWRVYGDTRLSDKKLKEFIDAKCKMRHLLQQFTPEKVLFSM